MAQLWYLLMFNLLQPRGWRLKTQKCMMYRAKITKIVSYIDSIYSLDRYVRVKDCQDIYIEVPTEDEAEQIELINETQVRLFLQKMRLEDLINNRQP